MDSLAIPNEEKWKLMTLFIIQMYCLWALPPSSTQHRVGKLKLCLGMPVMIKNNEATECGVTNGAETIIVGWKSENINTFSQYGTDLPYEILRRRSGSAVLDPVATGTGVRGHSPRFALQTLAQNPGLTRM